MDKATTKRFAVFDIDGTLIRWQMIHAIVDRLGRGGQLLGGDYELLRTARNAWKERVSEEGFKEYELQLVAIIERNLAHISVADFNRAVEEVFAEYKNQVYRYTRDLVKDLKQQGYTVLAVSGSPIEIVRLLADYYGFDDFAGTIHVQKDGKFTGEIIVAVHHKPKLLKELAAKHDLPFAGSIGVGDSEGDIEMLELVERPIAFNPSKKLFRHAQEKGWKIALERKNMTYELTSQKGIYRLERTNA